MRKYLLPPEGNWYKANLHAHTTVSDGELTPEEAKEAYKAHGYSIFAYTDHHIMVDHSYLADEDFLPLIGWEFDVCEDKPWREHPLTTHICFIALDNNNPKQHIVNRSKYAEKSMAYAEHFCFDPNDPGEPLTYSAKDITYAMEKGREAGFFVTYNHPQWSMETQAQ